MRNIVFIILITPSVCFSALNRTYPLSNVTQLRMDVYVDVVKTIAQSSVGEIALSTHPFDTVSQRVTELLLNNDMEQYLVLPPGDIPSEDWTGWCSEIINGNIVPIQCVP